MIIVIEIQRHKIFSTLFTIGSNISVRTELSKTSHQVKKNNLRHPMQNVFIV